MKNLKLYIAAAAVAASTLTGAAQETNRSGYFLEGYNFRHNLNPALAPERNYITLPAIGNMGIGINSNVGISTFLYKLNGTDQLTTFMSPTVSADQFLNKLQNNNKIMANVNVSLMSAGFRAFGGYNTIGINARTEMGVNMPKDLFRFMKLGQTGPDTRYSFSDVRVKARAFGEIALGHQRKITNELAAGVKVKFLVGIGNADATIRQMDVTMNNQMWSIRAQGEMNIAAGDGLKVPTNYESGKKLDQPEMRDQIDYDGIEYDHFSVGGYGLAFDLGATYDMSRFVDGLTLSAALTDLGFINWKNNVRALTPDTNWEFKGFQNVAFDSAQDDYENNKLSEQIDNMFDDLQDAANFRRVSDGGSNSTPLAANLTIGAEYKMPFYKRLSGGFLFTQHFAGPFSWTEGRFSANVKPVNWFDAAINYGASNFGDSFGWIINFHPKGFTFFIGSDHQFFKVTPQYVPVNNANFQFNFGMSITFGKRKV